MSVAIQITTTSSFISGLVTDTQSFYQSFTPSTTFTLTGFNINIAYLAGMGNIKYNFEIYLADDDNRPVGLPIGGAGLGFVDTADVDWRGDLVLEANPVLTAGTKYCFRLQGFVSSPANALFYQSSVPAGFFPLVKWDGSGYIDYPGQVLNFKLYAPDAPSKPTTPTPANNATEVNFSGKQLSWVNGGGATSYDVYIGPVGSLVQVATAQTGTSKTVTLAQCPLEQKIYWRVDAKNDAGTTTGDVWNFDARPAKVTTPTPEIDATGQSVFPTYEWNASTVASSYTLNIGIDTLTGTLSRIIGGLTSPTYDTSVVDFRHGYIWGYNSLYVWRVDAKNEFGTTEGDEWTFYTTHSNNFPWERPFDYNPDYSWDWDVDHYDWVDATLLAVGGGRYKQQLVAVGHGVIYFEE